MGHVQSEGQHSNRFRPRPNFIALVYISVSSSLCSLAMLPQESSWLGLSGDSWGIHMAREGSIVFPLLVSNTLFLVPL